MALRGAGREPMLHGMSTSSIRLYSTPICAFCRMAKRLLDDEGIDFDEIDLSQDDALRMKLVEETGWRTVPMIFINDKFVGGFQELVALHSQGDLEGLKAKAPTGS